MLNHCPKNSSEFLLNWKLILIHKLLNCYDALCWWWNMNTSSLLPTLFMPSFGYDSVVPSRSRFQAAVITSNVMFLPQCHLVQEHDARDSCTSHWNKIQSQFDFLRKLSNDTSFALYAYFNCCMKKHFQIDFISMKLAMNILFWCH